jgi:hypothetical protein
VLFVVASVTSFPSAWSSQSLESNGTALCWNEMSAGQLWQSRKGVLNDSRLSWTVADLPSPLDDDEDRIMVAAATFDPSRQQLVQLNTSSDKVSALACKHFFLSSEEPEGDVTITSVKIKIGGDLVDAKSSTRISWTLCRERDCNKPENTDLTSNVTTLTAAAPSGEGWFSRLEFHLELKDHAPQHAILINELKLTVFYNWTATPAPTPARPITQRFYDSIADWTNLTIAIIVIAAFCCGIVCAGVVYSICRRGKKPIAYDKA